MTDESDFIKYRPAVTEVTVVQLLRPMDLATRYSV